MVGLATRVKHSSTFLSEKKNVINYHCSILMDWSIILWIVYVRAAEKVDSKLIHFTKIGHEEQTKGK